jgi:hypothetical protein
MDENKTNTFLFDSLKTIPMKNILIVCLALLLPGFLSATTPKADEIKIQELITSAYINGLQNMDEPRAALKAFHPDFEMLINRNGNLEKIRVRSWVELMENRKKNPAFQNQPRMTGKFVDIDVTGHVAMVKLEMYREKTLLFTDYFSLYRFGDDWQIVSKSFYMH